MTILTHGQRLPLTALNLSDQLILTVSHRTGLQADVSLFGLNTRQKLRDDRYLVFYNQSSTPHGELTLLSGQGDETQRFALHLDLLPKHVARLMLVLTAEETLSPSETLSLALLSPDGIPQASFELGQEHLAGHRTVFACELWQGSTGWRFGAVSRSFDGGLKEVLEHFGGTVAEDEDLPDTDPALPAPLPAEIPLPPRVETRIALPLTSMGEPEAEQAARLLDLASRLPKLLPQLQTEEASKHALVMPFLQILGYDVFDPTEVVPEFVADVGIKRGEKVDYAIFQNGRPILLFECKHHAAPLSLEHASQLYRYFAVTEARFAVLTNGVVYRFYTDLEKPNTMDAQPFLEVNLLSLKENELTELLRFSKSAFNQDVILGSANEMKYVMAIKQHLVEEFREPSDEFIRVLISQVYQGRLTTNTRNRFAVYTKKALNEFVAQLISERLRSAFEAATPAAPQLGEAEDQDSDEAGLTVSAEEWQGYYVIKSILRETVGYARVHLRKHQSYCAVLLDNNRRKTVCRLYFSEKRLVVGLFDAADRHEARETLSSLDDLFRFAPRLRKTVQVIETKGN